MGVDETRLMEKVVADVVAERKRQIEQEGWTAEHDLRHAAGELSAAGAAYALNAACVLYPAVGVAFKEPPSFWTWHKRWWKPKNPRRDLVRAIALLMAEIEQMDRSGLRK